MSAADVAREIEAVLDKVRRGAEIVVEQDEREIAIIAPSGRSGLPAHAVLQAAERFGYEGTLDGEFGSDLADVIEIHRRPWNPPSWE